VVVTHVALRRRFSWSCFVKEILGMLLSGRYPAINDR
jgi:hypothetical protein